MPRNYDLNRRLIAFASGCIDLAELLPKTAAGRHIGNQLIRSATSPALHYGEAQSAESRQDFIHKLKICLKELRETFNNLQLILYRKWYAEDKLKNLIKENDELIAIFVSSIRTVEKKDKLPDGQAEISEVSQAIVITDPTS
jgi:four helix bundle protein